LTEFVHCSHHIRLLLSLCFFPLSFKPPEQSSATYSRKASKPSRLNPSARTRLVTLGDDPLALTHRKVRELAREMLNDVIGTNGVEVVCAAVKGYGMPERRKGGEDDSDPFGLAVESKRKAKGKGKAAMTDPDFEHPHDAADDPLAVSADRILAAEDLWDVLAGTVARVPRLRTREKPVLEVGGWELVRVLVRGWEDEWRTKRAAVGGQSGAYHHVQTAGYLFDNVAPQTRPNRSACSATSSPPLRPASPASSPPKRSTSPSGPSPTSQQISIRTLSMRRRTRRMTSC
jgi:hypothetical protein